MTDAGLLSPVRPPVPPPRHAVSDPMVSTISVEDAERCAAHSLRNRQSEHLRRGASAAARHRPGAPDQSRPDRQRPLFAIRVQSGPYQRSAGVRHAAGASRDAKRSGRRAATSGGQGPHTPSRARGFVSAVTRRTRGAPWDSAGVGIRMNIEGERCSVGRLFSGTPATFFSL
jgi:hypothetical protein